MNRVIILLGPTGVGKTDLSICLAQHLNTEIISADSMQIYRSMDIGTAKPTSLQRALVTHHMIDIVDPWEPFSAGKYIESVMPIMESLHNLGKIPLVVGGTGLYIKAMTRGLFSGPPADWTLRTKLLSIERGEEGSLYSLLQELDRESADNVYPTDTRRIIRALEVSLSSSMTLSQMQKALTQPLPFQFIKIGLSRDRRELYRLIEQRVDTMIQRGLIKEAKETYHLIQNKLPRNHPPLPALQAIGYKEIGLFLSGAIRYEEAVQLIKKKSKRYAKRQYTWFKKEENIHWLDVTGLSGGGIICDQVKQLLRDLTAI